MKTVDILAAIEPVVKAFEKLGVLYYISGSVASSVYGIPRATLDMDVVSNIKPQHIYPFVEILESGYYIDEEMILNAIHKRSSFNLIHLDTMLKIDIFIIKNRAYDRNALKKRRKDILNKKRGAIEFYIASPEDIILSKLECFRMGGEVSEQQSLDILGVLKIQQDLVDLEYLRKWSMKLNVSDLLEKAISEAKI